MLKRLCGVLLMLILALGLMPAGSVALPEGGSDVLDFADYQLKLIDYTLPNGLRVILAEDHSAPVVAIDTWYRVGAADDPEQRSGFAHLFEHMMFEGSANVPAGEWDSLLESIGARHNAYTDNDKTAFWAVVPSHQLPRVLWMESDRMASLAVTDASFQTQRQVVIQEYNQRVANRPFGVANLRLFTQPLQGYPPYERPTIGNVEDLQAATFPEVADFHSTYYRPNNATLVIVGDIDPAVTRALVDAYYGDIPAGPPVTPILQRYPLPAQFPMSNIDATTGCRIGSQETLIDPQAQVPRFAATVVIPPRGQPDYYALKLLTDILGSGDSSRFQQEIVRKGLAAAAYIGLNDYVGAGILYAVALPNQGDSVEAMRAVVQAQLDRVRQAGVTEAELARAKKRVLVNAITSFRESAFDSAEWLQDYALTFGDPQSIAADIARYDAVTLDDIRRVAQTYLCERPMNVQTVLQSGEEQLNPYPGRLVESQPAAGGVTGGPTPQPAAGELRPLPDVVANLPPGVINRTGVPEPLGALTFDFLPFHAFVLDNGVQVLFVEQHEVPKVHVELVMGGSETAVPADKQGIAEMLSDLITRGTQTLSAAQIADAIESAGGSLASSAALEWTSVAADVLAADADLAFGLLSDVAQHATFPQSEFDVQQTRLVTLLKQDAVNPTSMATRQFGRIAYGNHPYGYVTTPETVQSLSRQDVVDFYNTYYRPDNAMLVIVGDLTPEAARTAAERAFGAWPSAPVPDFLNYPPAQTGDTSVIYLVDRPHAEQASVQIGNLALNGRNPDRYALAVVNTVLGGGSASRLYTELREAKGYTYGVYSRFGQPNDVSTFRVVSDVDQARAGDAVRDILKNLHEIQSAPITARELEDARGLLTGRFALAVENPDDFADQLATRYLTGVPIEEMRTYLQSIQAVTPEAAQAAATRYIEAEHPVIVVVGDAAILKPQLETIRPVVVMDTAGKPIER
jgi:zinc protease